MTKIKFFKDGNFYYGFESRGHASGGEFEEIVCAGISALTETFYFSLLDLCGLDSEFILDKQDDGFLKIEILKNYIKDERVQFSFEFLILGLKKILESYPDYLKLEV